MAVLRKRKIRQRRGNPPQYCSKHRSGGNGKLLASREREFARAIYTNTPMKAEKKYLKKNRLKTNDLYCYLD